MRVGLVAKTYDEIYVLSITNTTDIYLIVENGN